MTPPWTIAPAARSLLASCAVDPPCRRRHCANYAMTRDEWTAFDEDARTLQLAAIREEWLANLAGFSWEGPRPGNPRWGTPQWTAMRERYFMLSDRQPSVEQAIIDAISRTRIAA